MTTLQQGFIDMMHRQTITSIEKTMTLPYPERASFEAVCYILYQPEGGYMAPRAVRADITSFLSDEEGKKLVRPFIHDALSALREAGFLPFAVMIFSDAYMTERQVDKNMSDEAIAEAVRSAALPSDDPDRIDCVVCNISGANYEKVYQYPYKFENGKCLMECPESRDYSVFGALSHLFK